MASKPATRKPKEKKPDPPISHAPKQIDKSGRHFKRLIRTVKEKSGYNI